MHPSWRVPLIVSIGMLLMAPARPGHPGNAVDWHSDLPAAVKVATEKGLPLFIVFR